MPAVQHCSALKTALAMCPLEVSASTPPTPEEETKSHGARQGRRRRRRRGGPAQIEEICAERQQFMFMEFRFSSSRHIPIILWMP
eukprot:1392570-Pyramimonas_sp.AAC.1